MITMKHNRTIGGVALTTTLGLLLLAHQPAAAGETRLQLDFGNPAGPPPPIRATVPVGESLRVLGPAVADSPIQWLKNGSALPGATNNPLVIPSVTTGDAGTYAMIIIVNPSVQPTPSQSLILSVGATEQVVNSTDHRLINLSLRGDIAAGAGNSFVTGFVVGGSSNLSSSSNSGKKVIVRAVGPSLALFGVNTPLARPVLRIFDSRGQPYGSTAMAGGLTYEQDLANSLARAGAFATPPGSADAVVLMTFPPGNYTAQVTSADGSGGTVLIEVYEVP